MKSFKLSLLTLCFLLAPGLVNAQYWRAMPPATSENGQFLSFSQDEKHVIYLSRENGVPNIYKVAVKGGAPEQVTKYTDGVVLRPISAVGKSTVIFMRPATPGTADYHLYLVPQAGNAEPRDLTPTPPGVSNMIVGSSYTGRFIYYTANKTSRDKHDIYRYDVWQNIHELVYANDKNYQPVSWTRDQNKVAVRDPQSGKMTTYDIITTEITPHSDPADDPATPERSINGKFEIARNGNTTSVIEVQSKAPLALNEGASVVGIAPKETLVAYTIPGADGTAKLFIYDVTKKTSTELTTVK